MAAANSVPLWENAVRHLQSVLHPDVFERWIAVIQPVSFENDKLTLCVDNEFYQTWLEEHYLSLIHDAVKAVHGADVKVSFAVRKQPVQKAEAPKATASAPAAKARKSTKDRRGISSEFSLNERYTFDAFIIGSCNSFAHAASLAVAQAPGRAYNPLFIYGGTGLGKTHLMQAIGQYVRSNSRATVHYISSEAFINEYIGALASNATVPFRKKYRAVDVLLIDDIHFLGGKQALQEEFFHTFNTLFDSHKQIVMTSDRPASEIVGLQQRLVTRFEWGLVTELEPPDLETRTAILRHKLGKSSAVVPENVLAMIAENVKSNIRTLEGALMRVASYAALTGQPITIEAAEKLLRDIISQERSEAVTFASIQKAVAEYFDIRVSDLTSARRPQVIAMPRQVAMFLCRRLTESSLPDIASAFDKTHATVLHACRQIEKKYSADSSFRMNVQSIAKGLGRSL